jgi:nudix-type nucleoside diphosphatase (YffH/AdpP family)
LSDRDDESVRILSKDALYRGWMTLTRYSVERRALDGTAQRLVREIEHHGDSAAVLPFDRRRGTVLLCRQFRLAAHVNGHAGRLIEVCAGMLDQGETPEDAARREAREELGVVLSRLEPVASAFVSPGASTERATLFLAEYSEGDRVAAGGGVDDGEDIEVMEMSAGDAASAIADGTIVDLTTIVLIQALLLRNRSRAAG